MKRNGFVAAAPRALLRIQASFHVTKTLRYIGLTQLAKDSCLFVKMNHGKPSLIISVLVDDLLILAEHDETVEWFHTEFSNIYVQSFAIRKDQSV